MQANMLEVILFILYIVGHSFIAKDHLWDQIRSYLTATTLRLITIGFFLTLVGTIWFMHKNLIFICSLTAEVWLLIAYYHFYNKILPGKDENNEQNRKLYQ